MPQNAETHQRPRQAHAKLAQALRDAPAPACLPPSSPFLGCFGILLASSLCIKVLDGGGRAGHPRRGSSREQGLLAPRTVEVGWAGSSRARGFERCCCCCKKWQLGQQPPAARRCPGNVPAMSWPQNQLERGLSHPRRASTQHCGGCQVAFCVISLTQVVSETLLQFAGGTKQAGISLFGRWRHGGRGAPEPPAIAEGPTRWPWLC